MQLRYGEPTLRRAVPLALALISVSNPRLNILDTLSKFSHDADPEVSYNSIFAMGMVGSGKPGWQLMHHAGSLKAAAPVSEGWCPNPCLLQVPTTPGWLLCCGSSPSTTPRTPTTSSWCG